MSNFKFTMFVVVLLHAALTQHICFYFWGVDGVAYFPYFGAVPAQGPLSALLPIYSFLSTDFGEQK